MATFFDLYFTTNHAPEPGDVWWSVDLGFAHVVEVRGLYVFTSEPDGIERWNLGSFLREFQRFCPARA